VALFAVWAQDCLVTTVVEATASKDIGGTMKDGVNFVVRHGGAFVLL
jgi:hypothetical protein